MDTKELLAFLGENVIAFSLVCSIILGILVSGGSLWPPKIENAKRFLITFAISFIVLLVLVTGYNRFFDADDSGAVHVQDPSGEESQTAQVTEAQDSGDEDEVQIRDEKFKNALREALGLKQGMILTATRLLAVTSLNLDEIGIKSLEGLEYFPNLVSLKCSRNNLSSLDLSQNKKLQHLEAAQNGLVQIDLSQNTDLEWAGLSKNALTSLDTSHNPKLKTLYCDGNLITSLDLSANPLLEVLSCHANQLTDLDVSENPLLSYLTCGQNTITVLDVSMLNNLSYFTHDDSCRVIDGEQAEQEDSEKPEKEASAEVTEEAKIDEDEETDTPENDSKEEASLEQPSYLPLHCHEKEEYYGDYVPYGTVTIITTEDETYTGVGNSLTLSSKNIFFNGFFSHFSAPMYSVEYTFEDGISFPEIKSVKVNGLEVTVKTVNGGKMTFSLPDTYSFSLVFLEEGAVDQAKEIPLDSVAKIKFDWATTPKTDLLLCDVVMKNVSFSSPVAFFYFKENVGSSIPSVKLSQTLTQQTDFSLSVDNISRIMAETKREKDDDNTDVLHTYLTVQLTSKQERSFLTDRYFGIYVKGKYGAAVQLDKTELIEVVFPDA